MEPAIGYVTAGAVRCEYTFDGSFEAFPNKSIGLLTDYGVLL
jgi:hypothetical protein